MARWIFALAQLSALYAIFRNRWRTFRWFAGYTGIVLAVTILGTQFSPGDLRYSRYIWFPLELAAMGCLILAAVEAFVWPAKRHMKYFPHAVVLLAVGWAGAAPWFFVKDPRWLTVFIQARDYIEIFTGAFLVITLAILLWKDWWYPLRSHWHLAIFGVYMGKQAIEAYIYLAAGKWNWDINSAGWQAMDQVSLWLAAACYLAWTVKVGFYEAPRPAGATRTVIGDQRGDRSVAGRSSPRSLPSAR